MERDLNFEFTHKKVYLEWFSLKQVPFLFTVGVLSFASGKNIQNPKGT